MNTFAKQYGPWALITGGASGIGAEFGRQLAARGLCILIIDIQEDMMSAHAKRLREEFGIEVRTAAIDLAETGFIAKIRRAAMGLEIGLLVNNAADGTVGMFIDTDTAAMDRAVAVNCRASLLLAREFAPAMTARRRGGIIFLSSASALQVTPLLANYAATKAYNLVLAEALWEELRPLGVDVLALCPGATDTPAFHKSGARIENLKGAPFMQPKEVVAEALCALGRMPRRVPGLINRAACAVLTRIMPRRRALIFMGRTMRSLYPDHGGSNYEEQ